MTILNLTNTATMHGIQTNHSSYPPGYMKGICKSYADHDDILTKLALAAPTQDSVEPDVIDLVEYDLIKGQEKLLEMAASFQAANLEEIQDILKFWHQVAIQEVSPFDVSQTDKLILVIYNYFAAQDVK